MDVMWQLKLIKRKSDLSTEYAATVLLNDIRRNVDKGPLLFLVYFNDVIEAIEHSSIVMYADDTILYVVGKDIQSIQANLSKDMDSLADWLRENELIINLKRGKTDSLLFGTAQRITKHSEPLKVSISRPSPTVITTTDVYKYLGVLVDSSLNLNSNFDLCYNGQLED
ncbi:Hypothetical predicted protein [Paramuricea clavata]|uniref:Uncharacterized protein n=1 Tax=Paramuricea clavata TaxID=317549 RepID=A0A7D9HD56_PARCT|nr:Hypothetical predicted protein [Paramuricea clavata]